MTDLPDDVLAALAAEPTFLADPDAVPFSGYNETAEPMTPAVLAAALDAMWTNHGPWAVPQFSWFRRPSGHLNLFRVGGEWQRQLERSAWQEAGRSAWIESVRERLQSAVHAASNGYGWSWAEPGVFGVPGQPETLQVRHAGQPRQPDGEEANLMTDQPAECDGYPDFPAAADHEALKRYANVRMLAEMLRGEEDIDERMLGIPVPRATPADRWTRAGELFDRMQAERAERERHEAELAERIAADPAFARMQTAFDAAKETCRTGHDAGCTYGGMSASHGYWLAVEDCTGNHGGTCDLRTACDGAEASTGFVGHEWSGGDWIWQVAACQPCADAYVAKNPEYGRQEQVDA